MPPPIRYAKNGPVSLAYQVLGDGPIDLLFVPGFVSHLEISWEDPSYERFWTRIARFARVILFDKRGMGLSDRDAGLAVPERTMDDIRAVLDAAGSERAAIFGVSEGGTSAILFAAHDPDRTRALILFGTYARLLDADDYPIGLPRALMEQSLATIEAEWGQPAGIKLFTPSRVGVPAYEEAWARFLRMASSPSGAANLMRSYFDIDARHVLPSVHAPTLVMHARGDKLVPRTLDRYLADHIPGARFVEFEGADHAYFIHDEAIPREIEHFLTGSAAPAEPDRVLATVMFTDIVGSTERAASLGDARWRELLGRHDSIATSEIDRFRGRKIKSTGDGVLATFDGPGRAIRCAQAMRAAMAQIGVDIRAGLHCGEVELVGDDVGGIAVHIAARVASEAGSGEVLASSTVRDLVAGSDLSFEERGARRLRGVPGEWRLYAAAN